MEPKKEIKPVIIYSGDIFKASYIKSVLEENGINAYFQNEYMSSIAPWYVEPGGSNTLKLIVSNLDYDQAIKIIVEIENENSEDNSGI